MAATLSSAPLAPGISLAPRSASAPLDGLVSHDAVGLPSRTSLLRAVAVAPVLLLPAISAKALLPKVRRRARRRHRVTLSAEGNPSGGSAEGAKVLGNIFDVMRAGGSSGGVGIGFGGPPENKVSPEEQEAREKVMKSIREFRMRPRDVKAYLDRFVIEQDDAKKVLSVALCDHYNWTRRCLDDPSMQTVNYSKPNILILGPTGSGKTYLVRTLAKMLGVPFAKADATKFSETGIVGEDAEDVVRSLVDSAGGDVELAQYGMVYIDEVDKISGGGGSSNSTGGYSGRQVQSNFLKIMEETEVSIKNPLQASLSDVLGGGSKEASKDFRSELLTAHTKLGLEAADVTVMSVAIRKQCDDADLQYVFSDQLLMDFGNESNRKALRGSLRAWMSPDPERLTNTIAAIGSRTRSRGTDDYFEEVIVPVVQQIFEAGNWTQYIVQEHASCMNASKFMKEAGLQPRDVVMVTTTSALHGLPVLEDFAELPCFRPALVRLKEGSLTSSRLEAFFRGMDYHVGTIARASTQGTVGYVGLPV